jgi:hypothetical protein
MPAAKGSARTPLRPKMPFIVATYVYAHALRWEQLFIHSFNFEQTTQNLHLCGQMELLKMMLLTGLRNLGKSKAYSSLLESNGHWNTEIE